MVHSFFTGKLELLELDWLAGADIRPAFSFSYGDGGAQNWRMYSLLPGSWFRCRWLHGVCAHMRGIGAQNPPADATRYDHLALRVVVSGGGAP